MHQRDDSQATNPTGSAGRCAILAGGRGTRIGGGKPLVELAGRSLIDRAVTIAREAGLEPVIVAKQQTDLGDLGDSGCPVVIEPAHPSHPLLGIATALAELDEPIVVCPCDMPLLPAELLRALAGLGGEGSAITVVTGPRGIEPLLGRYEPGSAAALRRAAEAGASAIGTLRELGARTVEAATLALGDDTDGGDPATWLANVNTPAERLEAERILNRR